MDERGGLLLIQQRDYEQAGIDAAVRRAFDHFGGASSLVKPGDRVLLKVNLVGGHAPERRATTDPSVVRAVARLLLDCGARPFIADSPGIDAFHVAAERAGFAGVARELGIPCLELTDPVPLKVSEGSLFRRIEASRLVLEADAVVNLPKMKTHGQMLLTLGVKNLFGCVVGRAKAAWHYDVGFDRDRFASLLLEIAGAVAPCLTILDGVVGMDGEGPTSGRPNPWGVVAAARDPLLMDLWLCRMMGVRLDDFPLYRAARQLRLPQCALDDADVAGDLPPDHAFSVRLPAQGSLRFLPHLPFLERAMMSRPIQIAERCIGCGRCAEVCPADALTLRGRTLRFDYDKCIRCYCCHEMCPVRAIAFRESPLVRFSRQIERLAGWFR